MQAIVSVALPLTATPKGGNKTYIYIFKFINNNTFIYLNDNKCNTLAEVGDIKKRWSGYLLTNVE